jgi:hypothetical protein
MKRTIANSQKYRKQAPEMEVEVVVIGEEDVPAEYLDSKGNLIAGELIPDEIKNRFLIIGEPDSWITAVVNDNLEPNRPLILKTLMNRWATWAAAKKPRYT